MERQKERQTAVKAWINDLIKGQYQVKEGWEPNYVLVKNQKISRVNLIGVVVAKADETVNYDFIVLDDGSGRVTIRSFEKENMFSDYNIGDIINVIGRPREYGKEIYVIPEIVKAVTDNKWVELRKVELDQLPKNEMPQKDEEQEEIVVEKIFDSPGEKLISYIKKLDRGEGADVEEIAAAFKEKNTEELIRNLLLQGDVFEIKPGRLKVLE